MRTGFIYTVLVFCAGLIFGLGGQKEFTKEVIRVAYDYGRESMIVDSLDQHKPALPNPGIKKPLRLASK